MKKMLVLLCLVSMAMPAFCSSYSDYLVEAKYKKAVTAGCPELKVKDKKLATALGLLPGGGSFYTRQVGLGVVDLLLWPISPIWDMPIANKKASEINKYETIAACEAKGKL